MEIIILKVVFRVDSSNFIGTGHVMRCLALAEGLRRAGFKTFFVCRDLPGNLCDQIESRSFEVFRLLTEKSFETKGDIHETQYSAWLGTSWQDDISQVKPILDSLAPVDWLVVDHYALNSKWESEIRPFVKNLMAIDDLSDRAHDVDLFLNQNTLPGLQINYSDLVPSNCRLLLGPRYALLQDCYGKLHNRVPSRKGNIERILIYFGGVDTPNLTGRSLQALIDSGGSHLTIDVVLPVAGLHTDQVRTIAARLPRVFFHENLGSLAHLMARADLAIGAGGTTSWERLCLGLPSLIITLSDNQLMIAKALEANNLACWLGHHDDVSVQRISSALKPLLQDGLMPEWSVACHDAVDGAGVERVVALMRLDISYHLTARLATVDDEMLVADWLIPLGIMGSSYEKILRTLVDDRLYVVEIAHGVIVGAVFCEHRMGAWNLSTKISPVAISVCLPEQLEIATLKELRKDIDGPLLLEPRREVCAESLRIALCSDQGSWINDFIPNWALQCLAAGHSLTWAHDAEHLAESQICFYLSYSRIVDTFQRSKHGNNLVVHESDLPSGRGWSPLTWQVLQGSQKIVVTLFEATEKVDAGVIYDQLEIQLGGDELVDDLRQKQAEATFSLCGKFIEGYPGALDKAREQRGVPSYFTRRTPLDSQINPELPLREQFNLLRVCDNNRYPAWFDFANSRYNIKISRVGICGDNKNSVRAKYNISYKPRILFTGGGGAGSEALGRLLADRYDVFFADADPKGKPYPIASHRWLKIPLANSPEFTMDLINLCRRLRIDLLIPTVDEELLPVARLAKPLGFGLLLPPEHFVARHLDKLDSNQFLLQAGLPAPKTVTVDQGRLGFPCIVKPRCGRGSRNVALVYSEAELQAQITLSRQPPCNFVVQEFVAGEEYTVMMAASNNGDLRAVVPVLVDRKRGITLRAATKRDLIVIEACQAIHAADPVPGCYNIQLIKEPDGSIMPFEINPRISTTACLGFAAGVDFISIFLGPPESSNKVRQGFMDFKDRLTLNRSWHNEII